MFSVTAALSKVGPSVVILVVSLPEYSTGNPTTFLSVTRRRGQPAVLGLVCTDNQSSSKIMILGTRSSLLSGGRKLRLQRVKRERVAQVLQAAEA